MMCSKTSSPLWNASDVDPKRGCIREEFQESYGNTLDWNRESCPGQLDQKSSEDDLYVATRFGRVTAIPVGNDQ
jgi:hypothetical protein